MENPAPDSHSEPAACTIDCEVSAVKPVIYLAASLLLLGITPAAWAGAVEEIAAIGQQRGALYEKGDADAYAAAFADNASFTPSLQPFRVYGKAAIKDYFTTFF